MSSVTSRSCDPSIDEPERFLDGLVHPGRKWGPVRVARLLEVLGSPHRKMVWAQVVGTCGKGSTAAALSSCLSAAGVSTGLFTSPHLVTLRERIRVDGQAIASQALARLIPAFVDAVRCLEPDLGPVAQWRLCAGTTARPRPDGPCGYPPSFFEALFALACCHFASCGVQMAVAEAGLGGGRDATSVLEPAVGILTTVGWDHTEIIGPTLADIAREKCRIVKPGMPLVSGVSDEELTRVVDREVEALGGRVHHFDREVAIELQSVSAAGTSFDLAIGGQPPLHLATRLVGKHQARNVALAVLAAGLLPARVRPGAHAIATGLSTIRWPARFECLGGNEQPWVIWDGGHNPDGLAATVATFSDVFGQARPTIVAGFSKDKAPGPMLEALARLGGRLVLTRSHHWRAADPVALAGQWRSFAGAREARVVPDPARALSEGWILARESGHLLLVGSIYLLGELVEHARARGIPAPR